MCLLIVILFVLIFCDKPNNTNGIPDEFYTVSKAFDDGYYPSMERVESLEKFLAPIDSMVKVSYISEHKDMQNTIWTVRVESIYYGKIEEDAQIDIVIPIIDINSFKQIDKSKPIILGLTDDLHTGLGSVFYIKNSRVYPAYDIEDFVKPLVGVTESDFKKYIQKQNRALY